jgi:predicted enzyme involved in methoxymalonyl-ACP biosynthesis
VLNRTVEQAVMDYVFRNCPGKKIIGEYRPTNKNAMVRDFYEHLGFTRETGEDDEDSTFWGFDPKTCRPVEMKHFVVLLDG